MRGRSDVSETPSDLKRAMVGDRTYISPHDPATTITMGKKYSLLIGDEASGRFVFNRQGQATYVIIQRSERSEDHLLYDLGKDVESWISTLSRQQIIDAGVMNIL